MTAGSVGRSAGYPLQESAWEESLVVHLGRSAERWARSFLVRAVAWWERAWQGSATGAAAKWCESRLARRLAEQVAGSLLLRLARDVLQMVLCPSGENWSLETLLGVTIGVAALLPTEVSVLLLVALVPVWFWRSASGWVKPRPGVAISLMALFLVLAGSALGSVQPRASALDLVFWLIYGSVFLLSLDAAGRGRGRLVLWPVLAAAALAGLVGLVQYATGWPPPKAAWLDPEFQDKIVRVVGTFDNPTFFAEYLGLAAPVCLALLLGAHRWRDRLLLGAFSVLQLGGLLVTFSRGGWLAFLVAAALVVFLYERRLLLLALAMVLLSPLVVPDILVQRFLSSFSLSDSSNSYRIFIWRGAWALAKAYLWTGTGLGADAFAYTYPEYMIIQTPAPHAHSNYLEMLVELGLPGMLVLLWFLGAWAAAVIRPAWRARSWWGQGGALVAGTVATAVGHLLHGTVEYTWFSPRICLLFWACLGTGLGAVYRARGEGTGR